MGTQASGFSQCREQYQQMPEKGQALRPEIQENGFLLGPQELKAHALCALFPLTQLKKEAGESIVCARSRDQRWQTESGMKAFVSLATQGLVDLSPGVTTSSVSAVPVRMEEES